MPAVNVDIKGNPTVDVDVKPGGQRVDVNADDHSVDVAVKHSVVVISELPKLNNPGTSADLMHGKELIDSDGIMVKGSFSIDGELSDQDSLIGQIKTVLQVKGAVPDVEEYEGVYDVTPSSNAQTLKTRNKLMRDDVMVKAIPFFEVSNNSGGNTVYIGTLDD
jgi:hypothetical protein